MTTLVLEIPDELDAALKEASAERDAPEAVVARQLLERALLGSISAGSTAASWLAKWRGRLRDCTTAKQDDTRLAFLLAKHLR